MKALTLVLFLLSSFCSTYGQIGFNDYAQFYPIGEDPNIRLMTSYRNEETILFEANPTVRFGFYNNFMKGLMNSDKHTQAWYAAFRPQLRMYTDNSNPVKTPSYRVLLGTQHLFRLSKEEAIQHFVGFSLESGHYSNGQSGCAFSRDFEDETVACDSIYSLITSSTDLSGMLNRTNGNFATNLTELILNYRRYNLDDNNLPKKMHSVDLGLVLYHDKFLGFASFGGYSDDDIKIYGRWRFLVGYEYMRVLKEGAGLSFSFRQNIEVINGAHDEVNSIRSDSKFAVYPFEKSKTLGVFISYMYGHDNYNFRFVDSGHQGTFGFTWNQFPRFSLKKGLGF